MKKIKIKDMMVPLANYATVSEDATLYEAVAALEEAQKKLEGKTHRHRAILVFDKNSRLVGKLGQLDILRGLEPKYERIGDLKSVSRFGLSPEFMRSMIKDQGLWQKPLDDICRKAAQIKVTEIMYTPSQDEYVDEEASLDIGIHQLVMGRHQSLIVTRGEAIVGILRLTDVVETICNMIRACAFEPDES